MEYLNQSQPGVRIAFSSSQIQNSIRGYYPVNVTVARDWFRSIRETD